MALCPNAAARGNDPLLDQGQGTFLLVLANGRAKRPGGDQAGTAARSSSPPGRVG